jgi:hypothetical protein
VAQASPWPEVKPAPRQQPQRPRQVARAEPPPEREPQVRSAFAAPPASKAGLLAGAQPVVATGSFSR